MTIDALEGIRLFAELNELNADLLKEMEEYLEFVEYTENTIITKVGEIDTNLYFMVKGIGILYDYDDCGYIRSLYVQNPGKVLLSISSVIKNDTSKYTAEVYAGSWIIKINEKMLYSLSEKNHSIALWYIDFMKKCIVRLTERVESFVLKTAKERLMELYENEPELFNEAMKKHLAGSLGITPNSFSRILSSKV